MTKRAAFANWKEWAEAAGEFVGAQQRLSERITQFPGVDEARLGKARDRAFIGIGLRVVSVDD
jgi:hypothetical protein